MEVGGQESPEGMDVHQWGMFSCWRKPSQLLVGRRTREKNSTTNTSLVAVSVTFPNGEAEHGLKLRERWLRRVSLLGKPVLCPELWCPLSRAWFLLSWE